MGRLFWKFFLFFFFAQLTTALGVGAFIQLTANEKASRSHVDQSPLSEGLVDAAQSTLALGGLEGLKKLLQRWESHQLMHRVFVVDANNQDILNREVDPVLLADAIKSASSIFDTTATTVRHINGQKYVLFVVATHPSRRGLKREGLPPPHEIGFAPPQHDRGFDAEVKPPPKARRHNRYVGIFTTFPLKALLIGAVASALFAAILAWYFSKPIESLRLAFKRAADGNLNVRVADKMGSRNDELSDLGRHFDYMAKRLSTLMQGQSRLLHHVSHELRSPLARIHMALGLALQNRDKVESSLNRIELEAGRMDKLIGELLELSRFESGMVDITKEKFSLNAVLETVVADATYEALDKKIQIVLNIREPIEIDGQLDLIHRAIENIVRNAVKYGPHDSLVKLDCEINKDNQQLEISVEDQGAGVLECELEDIFKPFVRGNSGSQVVGHGVGLAIAKQIAEAHGGRVQAKNIAPQGFCVTLVLPASCYSILPDK